MNQQPDKLFREKLLNYERTVSPGAWNRVSQKVARKDNKALFFKVAAAILLLVTGTWVLYPWTNPTDPGQISENVTGKHVPPPVAKDENIQSEKQDTSKRDTVSVKRTHENPKASNERPAEQKKKTKQPGKRTTEAPRGIQSPGIAVEVPDATLPSVTTPTAEPVVIANVPNDDDRKRVTIIFSADEVNEKYLAKNVDAKATPSDEQTSGLKKLLDKANDLKHNQDLLGSLRQKKNEILAMNFRNEKELTQND